MEYGEANMLGIFPISFAVINNWETPLIYLSTQGVVTLYMPNGELEWLKWCSTDKRAGSSGSKVFSNKVYFLLKS